MNFPTLLYTIREHCKIIIPPHFSSTCLTQWRLHLLDIWNQKLDFHILEMREKSHSEIVWLQIGKLIRSRQEIYIGAADSRQFSTRREKSRVAFKLFLSFKVEMNGPRKPPSVSPPGTVPFSTPHIGQQFPYGKLLLLVAILLQNIRFTFWVDMWGGVNRHGIRTWRVGIWTSEIGCSYRRNNNFVTFIHELHVYSSLAPFMVHSTPWGTRLITDVMAVTKCLTFHA